MREATIEKYLVEQVKAVGGEVRKVKWIGRNGAPDRVVMLPSLTPKVAASAWYCNPPMGVAIWVELKAPGKTAEPHQLREHKRMQAVGQTVVVIDSLEGVDELLRNYK